MSSRSAGTAPETWRPCVAAPWPMAFAVAKAVRSTPLLVCGTPASRAFDALWPRERSAARRHAPRCSWRRRASVERATAVAAAADRASGREPPRRSGFDRAPRFGWLDRRPRRGRPLTVSIGFELSACGTRPRPGTRDGPERRRSRYRTPRPSTRRRTFPMTLKLRSSIALSLSTLVLLVAALSASGSTPRAAPAPLRRTGRRSQRLHRRRHRLRRHPGGPPDDGRAVGTTEPGADGGRRCAPSRSAPTATTGSRRRRRVRLWRGRRGRGPRRHRQLHPLRHGCRPIRLEPTIVEPTPGHDERVRAALRHRDRRRRRPHCDDRLRLRDRALLRAGPRRRRLRPDA